MDFNAAIGCGFLLFFGFFIVAFYFQRLRWKRNKRLGKKHLGFCPSFSSLGNSLQKLQQIAIPQVEIVLQEKDVSEDENEEEISVNGAEYLHRQLKKIRTEDEIDDLTVLPHLWRP